MSPHPATVFRASAEAAQRLRARVFWGFIHSLTRLRLMRAVGSGPRWDRQPERPHVASLHGWTPSQHGGWVFRVNVSKKKSGVLHGDLALEVTQHHFCHSLLIKAITEVYSGLREGTQMPPFSGEASMSYYKKDMKDGKNMYTCTCHLWKIQSSTVKVGNAFGKEPIPLLDKLKMCTLTIEMRLTDSFLHTDMVGTDYWNSS